MTLRRPHAQLDEALKKGEPYPVGVNLRAAKRRKPKTPFSSYKARGGKARGGC